MSIKSKIDMSLDELIEKENIKANHKVPNEKKTLKSIEKNTGQKYLHSIIISNVNSNNLELYKKEFSNFGKIYNIYHDNDKKITYVKYDNKNSCENAISTMNNKSIDGDTISIVLGKKIPDKKNNKNTNQNNHLMNNNMHNNKIIPPFKMPVYNHNPPYPYYMNSNYNHHPHHHPRPYNHIPYQNTYQNNMFDDNMHPFNSANNKNIYDNQKNSTIIVTNVPTYLNAEDIFSAFQETGKIVDVQILMNEKRKLTGIVSIEYEKNESASDAVRMYDGGFLNDNRIRVFLDCR